MKAIVAPVAEFIIRLFSKSPRFFKALQWIIGIIVSLLSLLTYVEDSALINLPSWVQTFLGKESIFVAIIMYIIAKLPTEKPEVVQNKINQFLNKDNK